MRVLTEAEIDKLIKERKVLPRNWRAKLEPKRARFGAHRMRGLEIQGEESNLFRIVIRTNPNLINDFSVILLYIDSGTTAKWRLKRYNGNAHAHTNKIEYREAIASSRFDREFHVHSCTERYQMEGHKEDGYAEPTSRYSDWYGALSCLVEDCGFVADEPMDDGQVSLFTR